MALQKQLVAIPVKGLNTLADPKSAAPGECDLIENMFLNRTARGGAELKKRYGGTALSKNGSTGAEPTVTSGRRLATFDAERLLVANATMHSYSPNFSGWDLRNNVANVGVGLQHISDIPAFGSNTSRKSYATPDVAISGNLMAVAWMDTGTSRAAYGAVFDLTTGAMVMPPTTVDGGNAATWVRVIALSSVFMFVIAKGSTGEVRAATFGLVDLFFSGGATTIASDLNVSCKGDVVRNGANDSAIIAYHSTVPGLKVLVINSNKTAGASATGVDVPDQCMGFLNWDFSDGKLYFAYVGAAVGLRVRDITIAGTVLSAATTPDAALVAAAQVTGYRTGTTNNIYVEVRAALTYNCRVVVSTGGGATSTLIRSVGLGARVFLVSGTYYVPFAYESPLQNAYYTASLNAAATPVIVARSLYGLGGGLSPTANIGGCAKQADGTTVMVPVMRRSANQTGTAVYGISLVILAFGSTGNVCGPRRLGDNLHIPGGFVQAYAGEKVIGLLSELGFFVFPETPTLAQGGGGSLTLLGSYQYVAVYQFVDARGQVHRSAPSDVAAVTLTGANQQVTVTVPTLRLSGKLSLGASSLLNVTVEVYRTVNGGTTFFRILQSQIGANDAGVDTISFGDVNSDATISANEILYTTGGVLPHVGPPAATLMETWRNRLFLAGTENPIELWVSNEYSAGEGVSFSDALVIAMESDGGAITALSELDDRLVVFKRSAIYFLTGNGPTLTGDNQYQQPQRITSTVGAKQQPGTVRMRDGVMFVSTRGIYLLAHSGQVLYAGAGVDSFASLTVTGACVLEDEEQVRFTTAEGRTLVYHYGITDDQGIGAWTTFTAQAAVDCIVWNGKFVRLASDGTVTEETVGAYSDPGSTSINAKVRLAWLSLTQFFGRWKLHGLSLLGDLMATFTLTHRIAYDYDATVVETETKAVTAATLPPLQLEPARRRATAVQVTLEETSTTQGFTVSGWGLEVGIEPGAAKAGGDKFLT